MATSIRAQAAAFIGILVSSQAIASQIASSETQKPKHAEPRSSYCLDIVENAQKSGIADINLAPKLVDLGDAYNRDGATREAIAVYERALATYKKAHQTGIARALDCQLALGDLYEDCDRLDKATSVYNTAFTSASTQSYQVQILHKLAAALVKQNKYSQAEPLYKKTISIGEKCYGQSNGRLVEILKEYGDLLGKTNRPVEAKKLAARVQAILTKRHK